MSAKHTTGPLSVVIDSTCSGAWASIVENCTDPKTGQAWQRELGQTGTVFVEKSTKARGPNGEFGGYDEAPSRFKKTKDHAEFMANATLWAAAPDLLSALDLMISVFGPGVDSYGDGAGAGEIDAVAAARAARAKATGSAA